MSKLNPYKDEILELRKQGKTYPQIAEEIQSKYNISIHKRTICYFVNDINASDTFEP